MRAGRIFNVILAVAFSALLAACGDRKAEQANAFADLLQSRVLNEPGVHIPILSDEEREKIGPFVESFAILKGFNDDLTATVLGIGKAMNPAPQNVPPLDLPRYRPDLVAARDFFPRAAAGVDSALAKAEAARARLQSPEIVKPKFDAAFNQLVTQPAKALRDVAPLAASALETEIAVADFIEAHRADLTAAGGQLSTTKPAVRKQLEQLLAAYAASFAKVREARRNLELAVQGH